MKTARKSFNSEPYNCLKEWEESTFCQCGDNGLVLPAEELEKSLTNSKDALTLASEALGDPVKKSKASYRTAFFEAFPKNPKCFIRGEGETVEEAENDAWEQWQKIINCESHEWTRKNRTDGYAYCTKCPLSGSFLEPSTTCALCQTPTKRKVDKLNNHYCISHYLALPLEDILYEDFQGWGFSLEEQEHYFEEDKLLFKELERQHYAINEKSWENFQDYFIRARGWVRAKNNPLFGPALKTKAETHEEVKTLIPQFVEEILVKMKEANE